jgi:hypothetical protein
MVTTDPSATGIAAKYSNYDTSQYKPGFGTILAGAYEDTDGETDNITETDSEIDHKPLGSGGYGRDNFYGNVLKT